ncbi:GntR family transcriptional regulator [Hamadaea tsunoensis]|uniref:GntR family transcriptional regulator n=1 Tax=Hamadaea tsunoensis TaxID=53368 RepID=UPI000411D9DD|nr:GntR family transcriptional regulator [Hamadaea tsunoensis]
MFDDRSPIYQQIADKIKDDVLRGVLSPDDQVMSTNQYAAYYRINPATAAKGFQRLMEEGVLYKKRGIGMFVAPDAPERLRTERRERFFADVVDPMIADAQAVGVPLADIVRHIEKGGSR